MCGGTINRGNKWPLWVSSILSFLACGFMLLGSIFSLLEFVLYSNVKTYIDLGVCSAGILIHIVLFIAIALGSRWEKGYVAVLFYAGVMGYIFGSMVITIIGCIINIKQGFYVLTLIIAVILALIAIIGIVVFTPYYNMRRKESGARPFHVSPQMASTAYRAQACAASCHV